MVLFDASASDRGSKRDGSASMDEEDPSVPERERGLGWIFIWEPLRCKVWGEKGEGRGEERKGVGQ